MQEKAFKILGISSGRPMGNAEVMLRECLLECEKLAEVDVRIVRLRSLKIKECDGCFSCVKSASEGLNGDCCIQDDFEWLKEQILWADAIIFSDPCFTYMPTSEVITVMNRALGCGADYKEKCRKGHKLLLNITVGGSDTVDFSLPLQFAAMNAICPGIELVDQFYCDWIRGKGYIADQPQHMAKAHRGAKRLINRLNGYKVPEIHTVIEKLNPLEHKDDIFYDLEGCPVCHQSVVQMKNFVEAEGKFKCAVCGATGHIEFHGGKQTYVWDDDTVAHNALEAEYEEKHLNAFRDAHAPKEGEKAELKEFPFITPDVKFNPEKPYVLAIVGGSRNGTSELLARKALETATAGGKYEGIIIRINDLNLKFCTGCLICKVNSRYRGGIDECILKDDDLWLVDRLLGAAGIIYSLDGVNNFTYSKFTHLMQRFGHFSRSMRPRIPAPFASMISAYDDRTENAIFATIFVSRFFTGQGPRVSNEMFKNVPVIGDGILFDQTSLARAARVGTEVRHAMDLIAIDPALVIAVRKAPAMCPSCGLDLIELHDDLSVCCTHCDATGHFEHRFGQEVIIWDQFSVDHSRNTFYGAMLHNEHIDYSQIEDKNVLDDPKITAEMLEKYKAYDKLVKPSR
ncbi:MAG: flavodoxin family protein [Lachnospiraceae bacterium]|nr:flavodoxin family protein [Lachnospiraceae bacterium]